MNDERERLRRTARQLIETDRILAGVVPAPGRSLPELSPAAKAEAAPPAEPARRPSAARAARRASPAEAGTAQAGTRPAQTSIGLPIPPPPSEEDFSAEGRRKAALLKEIDANEVSSCTRCPLARGRTRTVFGEGNPDADIVFIGEGPGQEEDRQGRPFVGRAGELLTKMIAAMGLQRRDVYIANVVKCRPPGNRAPNAEEVAACWDYLLRQLKIIQPRVIVAMGNPATRALLNTTVGITRLRGQWQSMPIMDADLAGIKVMPTFHPAYLLRAYTPENRKKVWSDLQTVMEALDLPGPAKG